MTIAARLAELGITLPTPPAPVASYLPYLQIGELLYISGQLPVQDGHIQVTGKLGANVDLETGQRAARLCAINLLAQAQAALGDLSRIKRVVKLSGFVASTPDFTAQPQVVNGASDLMQQLFGEAGRHVRCAVGAAALPGDAAVEIEAIFAV